MKMSSRRSMVALGVAAGCAMLAALPAEAAATEVRGTVEASAGLNVRSGSPTGPVIDVMPFGSIARIPCWSPGPTITATWGGRNWTTAVWDAIDGYTTPSGQNVDFVGGTRVFSTDAWINTGADTAKLVNGC